jgi:hypothetical protein
MIAPMKIDGPIDRNAGVADTLRDARGNALQ